MEVFPVITDDEHAAALATGELAPNGSVFTAFGNVPAIGVTSRPGRGVRALPITIDDERGAYWSRRCPFGFDFLIPLELANGGARWP